jgi:hypothetical protein
MNMAEFDTQISRLKNTFGDRAYPDERLKLIWREVREFSSGWFEKLVDRLICDSRLPPLLPEFRNEISRERERLWDLQKKQHTQDAKDFYSGKFQPEDAKTICQYIIKRAQGSVSDQDYANFVKHLKYAGGET